MFTYGWDRPDVEVRPGSTTVEVTLIPIATGARLHLTHWGLAGPMADAHDGGWANHLGRLAAVAEGRDPGPAALAGERVPSPPASGSRSRRADGSDGRQGVTIVTVRREPGGRRPA